MRSRRGQTNLIPHVCTQYAVLYMYYMEMFVNGWTDKQTSLDCAAAYKSFPRRQLELPGRESTYHTRESFLHLLHLQSAVLLP